MLSFPCCQRYSTQLLTKCVVHKSLSELVRLNDVDWFESVTALTNSEFVGGKWILLTVDVKISFPVFSKHQTAHQNKQAVRIYPTPAIMVSPWCSFCEFEVFKGLNGSKPVKLPVALGAKTTKWNVQLRKIRTKQEKVNWGGCFRQVSRTTCEFLFRFHFSFGWSDYRRWSCISLFSGSRVWIPAQVGHLLATLATTCYFWNDEWENPIFWVRLVAYLVIMRRNRCQRLLWRCSWFPERCGFRARGRS